MYNNLDYEHWSTLGNDINLTSTTPRDSRGESDNVTLCAVHLIHDQRNDENNYKVHLHRFALEKKKIDKL